MKIKMTTEAADKVLARLRKSDAPDCIAYPYYNGRERGWTLFPTSSSVGVSDDAGISFAEYRSSDEIVVYRCTNPYMNGAQPVTDEAYRTARFFKVDETEKAAQFIANFLKKEVR